MGATLAEMLVVLLLGTVILTGVLGVYFTSIEHVKNTVALLNLKMELNMATNFMATEIRRAGFWHQMASGAASENPFNTSAMKLNVNSAGDCILFGYDKNGDGQLSSIGTAGDDEHYGFRLNASSVQARFTDSSYTCTASSGWENLTDTSLLNVTALSFTLDTQLSTVDSQTTAELRRVTISITGSMIGDATITQTVTKTVTVRNNYVVVSS